MPLTREDLKVLEELLGNQSARLEANLEAKLASRFGALESMLRAELRTELETGQAAFRKGLEAGQAALRQELGAGQVKFRKEHQAAQAKFRKELEAALRKDLEVVRTELGTLGQQLDERLKKLGGGLADLDSRVERQERRLAAIESFPLPPIRQAPSMYATQEHSANMPKRVRLGYAG